MKKKMCLWFRNEDGQAIVEAAFVFPILILILCGIIDFGWIYSNQLSVNNCSREGARYAVVNSDSSSLSGLVTNRVLSILGEDSSDVTVETKIINGIDVQVTVTKTVKVLTPIAGVFVPDQELAIKSTSVMRIG